MLAAGIGATNDVHNRQLTVWSAFNSNFANDAKHNKNLTRVCPLPILDAKANEYSSLITIMNHLNNINREISGNNDPTVIAMDMDLYWRAKMLTMVKKTEKQFSLRIGDLHVVMAMLRTIGACLEGSGLEDVLVEADVYGSATLRHLLAGNHVCRDIEAHTILAISLLTLCWKAFVLKGADAALEEMLQNVCQSGEGIEQAMEILDAQSVVTNMKTSAN